MWSSFLSSNVGLSILLYLVIMAFFVYTKPQFLYDHEKQKFKEFKTGSDGTIFPIWGIAIIMGIFSYLSADLLISYFHAKQQFSQTTTTNSFGTLSTPAPPMQQQQTYISPMMGGGMDMCNVMNGNCFYSPAAMYGGGYHQPRPYNVPVSKVWKNL